MFSTSMGKWIVLGIVLLFPYYSFAQGVSILGAVTDTAGKPLEYANIMARKLTRGQEVKFAIADHQGLYRLELQEEDTYELQVSYVGYKRQTDTLVMTRDSIEHDFKLVQDDQELDEVVIDYQYEPVEIKKDTVTYLAEAFASGNERKLKELLEKFPGLEVGENGAVKFQGRTIRTTMVEGKKFFGGGSKLAVENIPADAIDKIEIISHFSEVDFMKEVLSSDEVAMNVKLKEGRKNMVFGDLEGAVGADEYYLGRAALFNFTPKRNVSFIGDINNIGKPFFTLEDVLRFQGGVSQYIDNNNRPAFARLAEMTIHNQDVIENRSRFAALSFDADISEKLSFSAFGIFSKQLVGSRSEERIEYLTNREATNESRWTEKESDDGMALANIKLEYSPGKYQKLYYNGQFQANNTDHNSMLRSISEWQDNHFETYGTDDNLSLKQYLEWHRKHGLRHTSTLVVNHILDHSRPRQNWINDQEFLVGFLPLSADAPYHVQHLNSQKSHSFDVLLKHYWIFGRLGQLNTNIGNNHTNVRLQTSDGQILSNGALSDFSQAGFGNDIRYALNDAYFGIDYKFYLKGLSNTASLTLHWYRLGLRQLDSETGLSRLMPEPNWTSEYEFTETKKLTFTYALRNSFPQVGLYNERFSMNSYNVISRGNALLENERFHTASLLYYKFALMKGTSTNVNVSFNRKVRAIRSDLFFDGIEQYRMPMITDNPETNLNFRFRLERNVLLLRPSVSVNLSWFSYSQTINEELANNSRNNQSISLGIRTADKSWPGVSILYTKGFNRFIGNTINKFETDQLDAKMDIRFFRSWVLEAAYFYFQNINTTNYNRDSYQIARASLLYQQQNSVWGVQLSASNLLDDRTKVNNRISDFLVSEQISYILPRIWLLSIRYKL